MILTCPEWTVRLAINFYLYRFGFNVNIEMSDSGSIY